MRNLDSYRETSPLFTYGPLPENNVLQFFYGSGFPAGVTSLSMDAGYYLLLAPLPLGQHTIHFGGTFNNSICVPSCGSIDTTYHITVK